MTPNQTMGTPMPASSVTVSYTGTAGTTTAMPANANVVRVVATTDCFIEITSAGTAAVADTGMFLPANSPEYFACPPLAKVSAIQYITAGSIKVTPFN